MDARLTLTHLESLYELVCPPDQVATLRNELDGIARERLPQVLAEQLLPRIDPNYSVYRIRRIDIDLAISRQALKSGELPRLWARQILQQVFTELRYGDGGNVVRFADHAEFTAAFVEELVLGGTSRSWAFDDFAALRLLSPAEAIVQILVARPNDFARIADYFRRQGDVRRLASALDASQASRVLDALWNQDARPMTAAELYDSARTLDSLGTLLDGDEPSAGHRILLLLLQAVPRQVDPELSVRTLIELGRHAVQLQHALRRSPAGPRATDGPDQDDLPQDLQAIADDLPPEVRRWWQPLQDEADGKPYLSWLLRQVISRAAAGKSLVEPPETDGIGGPVASTKRPRGEVVELTSPLAGIGLLLPGIAELKLPKRLGMTRVRACTQALLADKQRKIWERDPLQAALFPIDDPGPLATRWPTPSETITGESLLGNLGPAQRQAVETATDADAWALLLAFRFARRLPGLESSSLDYLRGQFFARPGRVRIDARSIRVRLEPLPLGIVLKLAGCAGWQGRLPWLDDRELTMELPAG